MLTVLLHVLITSISLIGLIQASFNSIPAGIPPQDQRLTANVSEVISIRYVSTLGSDMNDGLSLRTAKHTVYGAFISLPGGGRTAAGSGTVYVSSNSSANPTRDAGIWLLGPNDPNYLHPPAGWLQCNGCSDNAAAGYAINI